MCNSIYMYGPYPSGNKGAGWEKAISMKKHAEAFMLNGLFIVL